MNWIFSPFQLNRNGCYSAPQPGFSLVELMVVVAIFGILLGIAIPAFTTMVANMRVKSAASDFVADLAYARAQAVTISGRVGVAGADFAKGWKVFRACQGIHVATGTCKDHPEDFGVMDQTQDEIYKTHPALHNTIAVCGKNGAGVTVAADVITYGGDGRLRVYNAGTEINTVAGILFKSSAGGTASARKVVLSPAGRVSVDTHVNPAEEC